MAKFGNDVEQTDKVGLANYIRGVSVACSEMGDAESISAYITPQGAGGKCKFAIYRTSDHALIGYTEEWTSPGAGVARWVTLNIVWGGVLTVTNFHIVLWTDTNDIELHYDTGESTDEYRFIVYNGFPDPIGVMGVNVRYSCIYCTYTPCSPSSSVSPSVSPSPSPSVSPSPSEGYQNYTRGDYAVLPANDDDLETEYTDPNLADVATKDNVRVGQSATGEFTIHQYKDFVGAFNHVSLEWEGLTNCAPVFSTVYLQIYNRTTLNWDTVDSDNSSPVNTDLVLGGAVDVSADYKDAGDIIACRVYQEAV